MLSNMRTITALAFTSALVLTLGLASSPAHSDSWRMPLKHRTAASPSRDWTVTISIHARRPVVALQMLHKGKPAWGRRAAGNQSPVHYLVSDQGHLVTLGSWHSLGYWQTLVIYAPDGKTVIDKRLEEILAPDELAKVHRTVSSRWWLARKPFEGFSKGFVRIRTKKGQLLEFRLSDGAQFRAGKRFDVPTDARRFAVLTLGKPRPSGHPSKTGKVIIEVSDNRRLGKGMWGVKCTTTAGQKSACFRWGHPKDKGKRPRTEHAVTLKHFEAALRASSIFATHLWRSDRMNMPGPHMVIRFIFPTGTYTVIAPPREIAKWKGGQAALKALKKVAPVQKH